MRPVAILQHDQTQRPGVLLSCLDEWGVPSTTVMPEEGDRVPRRARDFGGIVLLGSNRSVNDAPGWIDEELRLLRDAAVAGVPLLGHCFGAQLMARSMGASVSRNAWPNIGWSRLPTTGEGRRLFPSASVVSFNRHYETFAIPHGAKRLSYGSHCLNKPFSIGPHLAFQCHFEVTEAIVREWCAESEAELDRARGPSVQTRAEILSGLAANLPELHRTARTVYRQWVSSLDWRPSFQRQPDRLPA